MRSRLVLTFIAAVSLAGCGGASGTATAPTTASPEPSMAPSVAPSMEASPAPSVAAAPSPSNSGSAAPSGNPLDLGAASSDVSNLDSYRMKISAISGSDEQSLMVEATNTPTEARHYVLGGSQSLELITIKGQGSWMKQGKTWTPVPAGADAMLTMFDALAPDRLISAYALGKYGSNLSYVDIKDHNGVRAAHYHLDPDVATRIGAVGFPADGSLDAWVAVDGGYLVGMEYGGTDPRAARRSSCRSTCRTSTIRDLVIEAPATS